MSDALQGPYPFSSPWKSKDNLHETASGDSRHSALLSSWSLLVLHLLRIAWVATLSSGPPGSLCQLTWGSYLFLHFLRLIWVALLLAASPTFGGRFYHPSWGILAFVASDVLRCAFYAASAAGALARSRTLLVATAVAHAILATVDLALLGAFVLVLAKLGRSFSEWAVLLAWIMVTATLHLVLIFTLASLSRQT